MTKTSILLETEFMPGDIVSPKVDPEVMLMVSNYCLIAIDETGRVIYYTVGCSDCDGVDNYYRPVEITKAKEAL